MTKARFVLGEVKSRIPLLEEVLNEELGVSEDVLQATKQLIGALKEVITNQKLDFTRTDTLTQDCEATIKIGEKYAVRGEITIAYYVNKKVFDDNCNIFDEVKYDPWTNTIHVCVDAIRNDFDVERTQGLIQHELTHAYQTLLRLDKEYEISVSDAYDAASEHWQDKNENISAASLAVYFMNEGELSANANELYPVFLKSFQDNKNDYYPVLKESFFYRSILKVRDLNKRIESQGRGILTEASKILGLPVGNLANMCSVFPKRAMGFISKVLAKAKKDYDDEMRKHSLDYGINTKKLRIQEKFEYFDGDVWWKQNEK